VNSLSIKEKEVLTGKVSNILKAKQNILFAYIFGSFISRDSFKDIDVGIFISGKKIASSEFSVVVG